MTEYEAADLAASNASNLIGIVSLMQVQIGTITEGIEHFMTILFGYLAAACIAGARLSKAQASILTSLYVFWQLWVLAAVVARGFALELLQERFIELGRRATALLDVPVVLRSTSAVLLFVALLASLYFMWSVRNPKTN